MATKKKEKIIPPIKASVSDNPKPKNKVSNELSKKILDGKIFWIDASNYSSSETGEQMVVVTIIRGAELTESTLSFAANSGENYYKVELNRVKDTNFQGHFLYSYRASKNNSHKVDLQVFENRLGLFLTGTWHEADSIWECFIHLHYIK